MPDWLCGPYVCGTAGWLYDFQNLIAGLAAVVAAGLAVFVPEYYRRHATRHAQLENSNRVVMEVLMLGSHLAAALTNIKDTRKDRPAIAYGVELQSLRSLVRQSRGMLESVGALLSGPDDRVLLRIMWRLSMFRSAVEQASNLADLFQHEFDDGKETFVNDDAIDAVAQHAKDASAMELPPEMEAALLKGEKK